MPDPRPVTRADATARVVRAAQAWAKREPSIGEAHRELLAAVRLLGEFDTQEGKTQCESHQNISR